jgi:hypothetical protein
MIEHYTAGADQVRRAKAAIFKLKERTSNINFQAERTHSEH